jgi:hypothetical protein
MERPQAPARALAEVLNRKIHMSQVCTPSCGNTGASVGPGRMRKLLLLALIAVIVAMFLIGKQATFGKVEVNAFKVSREIQQVFKGQVVKPGTALLLDSNPATRDVTKASLEQRGYTVLMVGSKRAALEILERPPAPISLIVMRSKLFAKGVTAPGAQVLLTP